MRGVRVTERSVALVCAIVLATMSVVAVGRHNSWWQAASDTAADRLQNNSDNEDSSTRSSSSSDTNQSSRQQTNSSGTSNTGEQGKYTYTAIAGSSYTEFARKAIDAYVLTHDITVQPADRLNAEVALTNAAGAPLLEIGQSVSISQSDVASSLQSAGVATASSSAATQPSPTTSTETSSFVAVAGSSYTEFARQCAATYLQRAALTMTPAQRVINHISRHIAYKDIRAASDAYLFMSAINIIEVINKSNSRSKHTGDYSRCMSIVRRLRWRISTNKDAPMRVRLYAISALPGRSIFAGILRAKNYVINKGR